MDTHTAVATSVYYDYYEATDDETPTVIVSTANAYKFPCDVYQALSGEYVDDAKKATKNSFPSRARKFPFRLRSWIRSRSDSQR